MSYDLFIAIFLEITAAIATRFSEGFTRLWPTAIAIVFAVTSYFVFSLSLKRGMHIGIGYTVWSGVGIMSVALIGAIWLDDRLTWIQTGGMILVIGGLAAVQLGETVSGSEK